MKEPNFNPAGHKGPGPHPMESHPDFDHWVRRKVTSHTWGGRGRMTASGGKASGDVAGSRTRVTRYPVDKQGRELGPDEPVT